MNPLISTIDPIQNGDAESQKVDVVVVGAGQAGLATGYLLQQHGLDFVILDAGTRIGDSWRSRWDSLRLFSPARYDKLPGMPFPADPFYFPTKDEYADYLEAYAQQFELPVHLNTRVEHVTRTDDRYLVTTTGGSYTAENVISTMSSFQIPHIPAFANQLDPAIKQMHSSKYRRPGQLLNGDVLIVGAANSGAEIAVDIASGHRVWLSGRHPGQEPVIRKSKTLERIMTRIVADVFLHRVLTIDTPIGRKARSHLMGHGTPLVRTRKSDLEAAGIECVPRVAAVRGGLPQLEDGRVIEVDNVIWATGYRPNFSWIDLPIFGGEQDPLEPVHRRGVVENMPGFYFVGLFFQYAASSAVIFGMVRDAEYIVKQIAARHGAAQAKHSILEREWE